MMITTLSLGKFEELYACIDIGEGNDLSFKFWFNNSDQDAGLTVNCSWEKRRESLVKFLQMVDHLKPFFPEVDFDHYFVFDYDIILSKLFDRKEEIERNYFNR